MTAEARKPINHGTIGGHRAHYRRGEPMCEPCREANRQARGNVARTSSECGTIGGHFRHVRLGEPICQPCRDARAAQARRLRSSELAPDDPRHGTEAGYRNRGCRCEPCRAAGSRTNAAAYRRRLDQGHGYHMGGYVSSDATPTLRDEYVIRAEDLPPGWNA